VICLQETKIEERGGGGGGLCGVDVGQMGG
jgi:hypothetical protein